MKCPMGCNVDLIKVMAQMDRYPFTEGQCICETYHCPECFFIFKKVTPVGDKWVQATEEKLKKLGYI